MKSKLVLMILALTVVAILPSAARSHCEIPCGIYDDSLRFALLREDITTVEKSMDEIMKLSADGEKNYNQLVRWVTNKDEHADKFMDIVTQYFMTQRIKPADPADATAFAAYQNKVIPLHQMLVYAMKCKQTTDKANTAKLRELVDQFEKLYFDHQH